jgi:quercetin dioxygenase-like cupin family protein
MFSQTDYKKLSIEECVNQFNFEDTIQTKVGYQYWFADKDFLNGRTLKMSVIKPNSATHAPHQHQEDEFFFVLEGTTEFLLDGETLVGKPYSSFYCPPNSLHGIRNVGDNELKYLVIKKYNLNK